MHSRLRVVALALACLAGVSSRAHAQDATLGDPSETARFRFGPLRFTPSLVLSNIGVDNNVFNEADNPKQDTTAAFGPGVSFWVKLGQSRLSGKATGQYLYFSKYDNQRAWNTQDELRWDVPVGRFTPFVTGNIANTKDRPGYEIDSRVRQKQQNVGVGSKLRLSGKTELQVEARRQNLTFDNQDLLLGDQIAQALDRKSDAEELDVRFRLTPLTTFVVRSEAVQDRFNNEPARDTNSISVMPGFELRPQALISGSAFAGVRRFSPLNDTLPEYTGLVSNVSTKYILRATQFEVRVGRDVAYSYEVLQPYYTLTDVGLQVTQRLTSKWDAIGRGSRQALAYRNVTTTSLPERTDHSWQAGAGVGYRLAPTLRLGCDVNYYRRQSISLLRNYDGLRIGASFSYGLTQ